MAYPLPQDFRIHYEDLRVVTRGLTRPECLLAFADGRLVAAHGGGGYSVVSPDGGVTDVLIQSDKNRTFVPNGIALTPNGRVIFADLGSELGGIFSIDSDGSIQSVVESIDGELLPPSNFITRDIHGRLWFTVSTRLKPRTLAWSRQVADGFIAVADERGARIVADGIGYTNEIVFSPDGRWIYVNETYNQKTSRYPLMSGARLGQKEVVAQYDGADFPDGLTFDEHGGLWVTCIGSNRLLVLRPDDGTLQIILADTDAEYAQALTDKLLSNRLQQSDMSTAGRSRLGNISSLAFGGPDRKVAYLGCLLDDCIRAFESPLPGLKLVHWNQTLCAARH